MMMKVLNRKGFTIIELVIIILVLGVIAAVSVSRLSEGLETAQVEHTKAEMDAIATAVAGNAELYSGGARTSFGYVGDNGALPPNLQALVSNPGLGTWNGPYLSTTTASNDYATDAWGVLYVFNGTSVTSTGSGSNLTRTIAQNGAELLSNTIQGTIADADGEPPGADFVDSVAIRLKYPDGAGAVQTATVNPDRSGLFSFNTIPIGNHRLELVYIPANDTTVYPVTVLPGRTTTLQIGLDADLW